MNKTLVAVGVVAVAALVVGVLAYSRPMPEVIVGAAAGPEHTITQFFLGGAVDGNRVATTTSSSTPFSSGSGKGSALSGATRIDITPATYQPTFNFPAEVDLGALVPRAGMTQRTLVCNATSTTVKNGQFTLGFGAGINVNQATTSLVLFAKDCADVVFSRDSAGGLDVIYTAAN